jgi:hypothetical protein
VFSQGITLLASLLLASAASASSPEQSGEGRPDATVETLVHAAAPAVAVPIERPAKEGLLVLPRLPDPAPPAMPAELEEQRRASLAPPGLTPAEPAPMASLDRIIIERPAPPDFDLSSLRIEPPKQAEPIAPRPYRLAIAPDAAKALICGLAKVLLAKAEQTLRCALQRRELLLRHLGLRQTLTCQTQEAVLHTPELWV